MPVKTVEDEIREKECLEDRLLKCRSMLIEIFANDLPDVSIPPKSEDKDLFMLTTLRDAYGFVGDSSRMLKRLASYIISKESGITPLEDFKKISDDLTKLIIDSDPLFVIINRAESKEKEVVLEK